MGYTFCDWLTAYDKNWLIIFRHRTIVTLSYIIGCYYAIGDYDILSNRLVALFITLLVINVIMPPPLE